MRIPARRAVFEERLELLVQLVQMIMARVQRVVFVALHQYLGLSKVNNFGFCIVGCMITCVKVLFMNQYRYRYWYMSVLGTTSRYI